MFRHCRKTIFKETQPSLIESDTINVMQDMHQSNEKRRNQFCIHLDPNSLLTDGGDATLPEKAKHLNN